MKTTMIKLSIATIALGIWSLAACSNISIDENAISENDVIQDTSTQISYDTISPATPNTKKVQVVFALDATGSMSGLIGTAKDKIWSIASSFAQDTTTEVEVGLVFYRDKGDRFITKKIQLSKDLDDVYEQLMTIEAEGGGDSPESVNRGLYEAIALMQWSHDTTTFKTVFLVGDCPPHMDYKDDVKYPESCKLAREKDIIVNTILMGTDATAMKIWKEIAKCAKGEFLQVNMDANSLAISTPYDDKIADVSSQIDGTRIYYGSDEQKHKQEIKKVQSDKLKSSLPSATAARRAEYNSNTKSGKTAYMGENELLNDYKEKKIELNKVPTAQLPDQIQKMTETQRTAYLNKLLQQRDSLQKQMEVLITQRKTFVEQELAKKKKEEVSESFDNKVYENVKKQASKKNIPMKGNVKF